MTDVHYLILGLIVLALFMYAPKILGTVKPVQASPVLPPVVRLSDPQPQTQNPLDPGTLANLLHNTVEAKGQILAINRQVEQMIEGAASRLQLTFSPQGPAAKTSDAPKA